MGENKYPEYVQQLERLKSFKNFPRNDVSPSVLVDAGYFYFEEANDVICYSCGFSINAWRVLHKAVYFEHERKSECVYASTSTYKRKISYNLISIYESPQLNLSDNYTKRLNTFKNWPISYINKKILADNGFYYLNYRDMVQCEYCLHRLYDFKKGDDIIAKHEKLDKYCPFVMMELFDECIDIKPKTNDFEERLITFEKWPYKLPSRPFAEFGLTYDAKSDKMSCKYCDLLVENVKTFLDDVSVYGNDFLEILPKYIHYHLRKYKCTFILKELVIFLKKLCMTEHQNSFLHTLSNDKNVYESMKEPTERAKTFQKWPNTFITSADCVSAGLFYLGVYDTLQCPFCHTKFDGWGMDTPLERHIRESPNCEFLKKNSKKALKSAAESSKVKKKKEKPDKEENQFKFGLKLYPISLEFTRKVSKDNKKDGETSKNEDK